MRPWRWIRRQRFISAGLALVFLVVAGGAGTWYFVLRSPGTRVGLGAALRQFRAQQAADGADWAVLPSPGVYHYRSSGDEALSIPGIGRSFPADSYVIVTDRGRCTTMEWRPFVQHMEGLQLCTGAHSSLVLSSAPSYEQIAGVTTTSVMRCGAEAYWVPPQPTAGERWHAVCRSPGVRVSLAGEVVGSALVRVGGRTVPALHTRLVFRLSGSATGSNPNDFWISARDGLILRQRETVSVAQGAGPLGSVRYREQMAIDLSSLVPTTGAS